LFTRAVDGAIVGQPLYLPNVAIPGKGTHNVVYAATMHDSVYAFDAESNGGDNEAPLWSVSFADPAHGITSVPIADQSCEKVNAYTEVGVVPAMVIDTTTGTLYVLAKTEENGVFVHRLHALSTTTGAEKLAGPVQIVASVQVDGTPFQFVDQFQISRPGLVLANGNVYVSFGSLGCKHSSTSVGWIMAYSASTLQQKAVFTTNPRMGYGSSIWQAGVAPAVDSAGILYLATADGPFDADSGGAHYGDSVLKLNSNLVLLDYFTPDNQSHLYDTDLDLGSGGVLLLPDQAGAHKHEMIVIGKEGSVYVVDRDNLGKFDPNDNSQIPQFLPFTTGEVDGVALYWNSMLYAGGQEVPLQVYLMTNGQVASTPFAQSNLVFVNPAGLVVSANGNNNAVLWVMEGKGAAAKLYAFDALTLHQIYGSTDNPTRDGIGGAPHFVAPLIANGRLYLGGSTKLNAFGLLKTMPIVAGNSQSGTVGTVLPTALKVQLVDPYGASVGGLSVTFTDAGAGGTFNPATAVTDASGFATTKYTLPTIAKSVTITATFSSFLKATFSETAKAGAPFLIKTHTGFNQIAAVNTPLPAQVSAAVKDSLGNGVPNVVVTFDDGGVGGIFSSRTVTTNSSGWANVNYTTPSTPQVLFIHAAVGGVTTPATFKETVTAQ
jgi:hypothetical protein